MGKGASGPARPRSGRSYLPGVGGTQPEVRSPNIATDLACRLRSGTTIDRGQWCYGGMVMAGMPVQLRAGEVRATMIQVDGEQWLVRI
jgi:hypothetical protein